ncbi:uncharacterized protein LOC115441541 isoform X2 [Manduca sexta]|uniref:uncharacterized protein LOC115441541 isoform X2 n=1 Tax=Manduca sexta TaxID=7130 RepID=UPI0018908CBF|nr:uncharacterized protein LOC115441541 isoform X2 [Manduca sexta]
MKLNAKQLDSIREWGEFEVPSRHFPGQTHVWRVSGWLQRGRARAREELYRHVARAVALLVVVARDRLLRDQPLSVRAGINSLIYGLHRLLDLIFGMPSMVARDLEKKIREERSRYLVAELICKAEQAGWARALAAWVMRSVRRRPADKRDHPPLPCLYTTPQGTHVDLRLYRRELLRRAAPILQTLLERESRGWFLHFRERQAANLAKEKMPVKDIEEEVREAAMREYVSRVCSAVQASAQLQELGADVPDLLVAQLRAFVIVNRAEEGVRRKLEAGLATAEARIRASHPILSRADAWRKEKLTAAAHRLNSELRWTAMEDAAAAMQAHKLHQHRYFLLRDLAFLRDREPLLTKELRAAKSPTREFEWARRIWVPRRWVVLRQWRGRAERVPTVLGAGAGCGPPAPAPGTITPRTDAAQPVYLVRRHVVHVTSTRWPAWRLLNLAHRIWCWSWNMMFVLGVLVPWCSPVSLRTLLCVKPFIPDLELSQVNGALYPKRSKETQTMWSRLLALWRHVSKERTRFETEPDTGLLGKGLSRQANRIWNYGIVGGLGSAALLLLFPLVSGAVSCAALAAAVTVPLWTPPLALALHAAAALLYDIDCPDPDVHNRWFPLVDAVVWRIGVLGVLQVVIALLVALVLCPIFSLLLLAGGAAAWAARGAWEAAAWRALIVRAARVPAHDSAFCRRVRGPGLHAPTYYQISCAQAVAAVVARAELEVLSAWAADTERAIERPLRDYEHFVHACFGPFSVQIAKTGSYRQVERECTELVQSVREKLRARRRELSLSLPDTARARVRLAAPDLTRTIEAAAAELSGVWRHASRADDWWTQRGLERGHWRALAANTLVEVFDAEVVVPLQDGEARLALEGGEAVRSWATRCGAAPPDVLPALCAPPPPDHDDAARYLWCEWGSTPALRVAAPALDAAAFSPRAPLHPPVPHPATVALVLHNRDSDNPVPLESDLYAEILKSLEDAPDCTEQQEDAERYRGGGGTEGSSSDGSVEDEDDARRDRRDFEEEGLCRVSPRRERAACRWTLTGRGVRLRADLASPEDVTLDADGVHSGTSV